MKKSLIAITLAASIATVIQGNDLTGWLATGIRVIDSVRTLTPEEQNAQQKCHREHLPGLNPNLPFDVLKCYHASGVPFHNIDAQAILFQNISQQCHKKITENAITTTYIEQDIQNCEQPLILRVQNLVKECLPEVDRGLKEKIQKALAQ